MTAVYTRPCVQIFIISLFSDNYSYYISPCDSLPKYNILDKSTFAKHNTCTYVYRRLVLKFVILIHDYNNFIYGRYILRNLRITEMNLQILTNDVCNLRLIRTIWMGGRGSFTRVLHNRLGTYFPGDFKI